jgi:hypothetical protein
MQLDAKEIGSRLFKYLIEGIVVIVCAMALPSVGKGIKIHWDELLMLGLVAAATFSILDLFAPSVAVSARGGAGLAVGAGLVGGIPLKH